MSEPQTFRLALNFIDVNPQGQYAIGDRIERKKTIFIWMRGIISKASIHIDYVMSTYVVLLILSVSFTT